MIAQCPPRHISGEGKDRNCSVKLQCRRKESGKVLRILDGPASHCLDVPVLDSAAENGVILFHFPSHITQYLQCETKIVFM
ncbi:hypothetical protein TNIN_133101 [Trichonephila inaurata madagascariensis]|uniref:Uncharacterized protein n=1 Tax=Trichonephila inaurata madagascariensis TaxID=2747483 RepID=A0A8X6XBQ7_9ARAC|nr:hypothetical protein TNIN_133101 [Trichonephila inaurata madagascariensis]